MIKSKATDFLRSEIELAEYAKALAHPARIAILNLLISKNACICGDIVDELPLAQSTVSQHLKELKEADLIKGEIEGTSICYCINEKEWESAGTLITSLFDNGITIKTKCC